MTKEQANKNGDSVSRATAMNLWDVIEKTGKVISILSGVATIVYLALKLKGLVP